MRIAYFDCFTGISGDMCLGALVDAGVSIKTLENDLKKIPIGKYKITARTVLRNHFVSKKVDVVIPRYGKAKVTKRWKDIEKLIQKSSLSEEIKQRGQKVFKRLFIAEAKVHGETFENVHLHELGAVDTVVDIFGTIIGLAHLGIDKIYASPINIGSGCIETEVGVLPVPAPATAEILKKVPVYSRHSGFELTTPTGAAIIKELSSGFGDMPLMDIEKIGIGAGNKDFKDRPNILRLFISKEGKSFKHYDEKVTVIETNIDDMNPQLYEHVMEKLFKAGALDVFLGNVIMKKGRPGIKITVLSNERQREDLISILLKETSTTGLRFYEMKRRILQREIKTIDTVLGKVKVKISRLGNGVMKATPEYEDCKRVAKKFNIPLIEVMKKLQ